MRNLRLAILWVLFFLAITTVVSAQTGFLDLDSATLYRNAGKYNEAIQLYKIALVKTTDLDWKYVIFSSLSYCHSQLKQYDEAIKTAQLGLEIAAKLGPEFQSAFSSILAVAYQDLADSLSDKKDYGEAIVYWKKAIELNYGSLFCLSNSYYYSGRFDDALDAQNKYIDSLTFGGINCTMKIVDNYPVIDEVLEGGSAQKEGLQAGDKIIKVGSKSTKKQSLKEIISWIKGKDGTKVTLKIVRGGVKKSFKKTLTRKKTIPQTAAADIAFRSLIQRHRGKTEEALKDAELAYSLDSRLFYPILAFGASYLDRGQYDRAVSLLSWVRSSNLLVRLIEANARILEATAYAKKGDFKNAVNIYSAIPDRDLSPKDVPIWSDRDVLLQTLKPFVASKKKNAEELQAKGQYKEALNELCDVLKAPDAQSKEILTAMSKIIRADPRLSELPEEARKYALRGDMMMKEGKFEEAIEQYRKALQAAPYIAKLYFNAAMIYGEMKKYPQAVRHIKTYLQLAPDAPNARAAQDQIYKWEFMMEGE